MSEPEIKNSETVLEQAAYIIKQRQSLYGSPEVNFHVIAEQLASLGFTRFSSPPARELRRLDPSDIATIMIVVKLSREWEKHNRDNLVDIAGYVACDAVVKGDD